MNNNVTAASPSADRIRGDFANGNVAESDWFMNVIDELRSTCLGWGSKGVGVGFAGTDADGLLEGRHENFAVADLSGAAVMASTTGSSISAGTATSIFNFGRKLTAYSAPR